MNKSKMKTLAYIMMLMSSLMAMTSSNIMLMWIMLEINSMTFIFSMKSASEAENMIKYFLIQASGSIPILMTMSFMANYNSNNITETTTPMSEMMLSAMMMKMGAAPFHLWMIVMTKKMKWINLMMMITVQKMAPIFLTGMFTKNKMMMMFMILSSLMGSIPMMVTSKMKTIMAMSSTNHTSWMMMAEMLSKKTSILYMMLYMSVIAPMISWTKNNKSNFINWQNNQEKKSEMIIIMMSMAGIPPTTGFLPKMMVIFMMMKKMEKTMLMSTTLIASALFSAYAYMRLTMKSMTNTKKNNSMSLKNKTYLTSIIQMMFFPISMMVIMTK